MGWKKKTVWKRYVDYWLRLEKTDLVTGQVSEELYKHQSKDMEPDIFIDKDNENELDPVFWEQALAEDFPFADTLRTVEYMPTSSTDEDQVRTLWIYMYTYRKERDVIEERERHLCVNCEHYIAGDSGEYEDNPFWCDFRHGMSYYCPGYADLATCGRCKMARATSQGKCLIHARVSGVTGHITGGNCSEWNMSGECQEFSERFDDLD